MKNYREPGENMKFTAGANLTAGQGLLIGALFGIVQATTLSGDEFTLVTEGVYDLPKADSQAWTQGAKVYWDDTNKVCTTSASGNTLIGYARYAVASTAGLVIGTVRLIHV